MHVSAHQTRQEKQDIMGPTMKTPLHDLTIQENLSIKDALQKLDQTAERTILVMDQQQQLIGTVSDGDIRRYILRGNSLCNPVSSVCNTNPIVVFDDNLDMEQVKKIFLDKKIELIPVIDANRHIVNYITWSMAFADHHKRSVDSVTSPVIIMAGGKGARLDPFTRILPKPLIPIGNKPVIEVIMEKFHQHGFYRFFYTLNYKKEYLKLFLKESSFPYSIEWVDEDRFLGTAGGLALLKNKIDDTFFVTNCDSILETDFLKVLEWHKEHHAAMTIVGCYNEIKIQFGVLELSNSHLKRMSEKPVHDVIINTGVYIMEPHVVSYIPDGEPMDMNVLIDLLIKREKVAVYPIYGGWFDIGQWEEYKNTVDKLGAS
ncbi:MAG: Glucose-1-phosphate cytidylyltransferase [Syntrophorhabdus sp. PtaB.Bin006]|nr:MAG: Glucose-1-phosphate cytidylyltransferase [Syntrophorhabdus sp. PtaB.Bin006]